MVFQDGKKGKETIVNITTEKQERKFNL